MLLGESRAQADAIDSADHARQAVPSMIGRLPPAQAEQPLIRVDEERARPGRDAAISVRGRARRERETDLASTIGGRVRAAVVRSMAENDVAGTAAAKLCAATVPPGAQDAGLTR